VADGRDARGGHGYSEIRAERDAMVAGGNITINYPPPQAPSTPGPTPGEELCRYLEQLAGSYQWLELQGIRGVGRLRIELEKVYVALKTEPETDYDLRHMADLHSIEVREAADGLTLDLIDPARLEELDAENVRRTYRPRREEARLAAITDVQNIADAFRLHHRIVLLGGPGSGKTTLGHWLALQLARGMLRQLPAEVPAEDEPGRPWAARLHVPAGTTAPFARGHFIPPDQAAAISAIRIDALPARGKLAFQGAPVAVGQPIGVGKAGLLTFTPAEGECGSRYAHLLFTAGGRTTSHVAGAVLIDVGTHVQVPATQVDPDHSGWPEAGELADLGPARVPVFLRLAHFARELAERERGDRPAVALDEYLGRDPDSCGRDDGCTPDRRNTLLRQSLADGQAIVILDGLDELPEANRRDVLQKIQDFIEAYIPPNAGEEAEAPGQAGGNQVVVTSRYVGYRHMPIRSGCAHFGIQAMRRPAVEHFARSWAAAVNAELAPQGQGQLSAEELLAEIFDDARPAIRELATNPLLITILAIVYLTDGRLPDQRAGVYDRVVENLLQVWLSRPECQAQFLLREELLAALEPLAADMQGNGASNGLIDLGRIRALIEEPLARRRDTTPDDDSFRPVLEALLTTVQKQVGLLAEQSAGNYAFFHRTFQEFLAARHLLAAPGRAAASIVERLDDPQWREPLLLALGLAMSSPEWDDPEYRAQLLDGVLEGDDRGTPIPRAALLVMSALPGLTNVPRPVLARLIGQLLHSYALSQGQAQAEGLRDSIHDAFARIHAGPAAGLAAEVIAEAIRQQAAGQDDARDDAGAAAEILLRLNWFTTEIADALLQVAHRDQDRLGWPVRWALLAALGQPGDDPSWPGPGPALDISRLVAQHLPMRQHLESSPGLLATVRGDADWLWLLVALYGGLGHGQARERLRAFQGGRLLDLQAASGDGDAAGPPPVPPIEFSPGDIVCDLGDRELSRAIQQHLREGKPAGALAGAFRQAWLAGSAEALVGLAALGEDVVPLVRAALTERDRQPAVQAALSQFRWLGALLQEPVVRTSETAARTIPEAAPEEHQLDLLRVVIRARVASGAGPLLVSDTIPAHRHVAATSDEVRAEVDGEYWAYLFSGLAAGGDDSLDGALLPASAADPGRLARGWSAITRAGNLLARPRLPWPREDLAPRPGSPAGHYLAMLDEAHLAPREYAYHAGLLLGRCRPLLADHPALTWETLVVCCSRGRDFMRGYLTGATGDRPLPATCTGLAAGLAAAWGSQEEEESLRDALAGIFRWRIADGPEAEESIPRSAAVLLAAADMIGGPYLRFRALWRTMWYTRIPLQLDINGVIAEITDPQDQARVIEWLIASIPDKKLGLHVSEALLDVVAQLVARIADPENRAQAQARLAFIAPGQPDDLLSATVASVGQIPDPRRRAEAILDIRAAVGGIGGVAEKLDAAADALPEQWLRDKARQRDSRLVAAYRTWYGAGALAWRLPPEAPAPGASSHRLRYPTGHLAWGTLYLSTVAAEVGALDAARTGDQAGWELLLGPDPQAGVAALIESAAEGGLPTSAVEATLVGRVLRSGRAAALGPLWPYLESPDAGAMAIIARWAPGDEAAQRWRALVQMEGGRLTTENIGPVVELLTSPQDRLRLRAALALHGPHANTKNRNRRWSVTRVGAEAIEALAGHATRADYPPSMLTILSWVQHDIHHDDAEALSRWISAAATGEDLAADWILKMIESIDGELVAPLLAALPSAPPGLQRTLLKGLTRVADVTRVLDGAQDAVRDAIAAVPREVRRDVRAVPKGAVSFLTAAAGPDAAGRLDGARSVIEESMLWLDDQFLADGATCLSTLRGIGSRVYVRLGRTGYFAEAREAAAALAENEDVLRLLLDWAESDSRTGGDPPVGVMAALDAVARISPNAFAALADPDTWEPILIDWVATGEGWVGRLSAVRLLGMLRRVTDRVADALRVAMKDNSFVQRAAYAAVAEFRSMKGDVIPELLDLLADPSAGVAASTVRLLVSLSRGEGASDRRRILRGLQDAVTSSPAAVPVYLMRIDEDGDEGDTIEFVDRLDRILYLAIFEVSDS
jgi:hypothetical protein